MKSRYQEPELPGVKVYELSTPNENAWCLEDMIYGRRSYDEERLAYSKAMSKWKRGNTGERPLAWRDQLSPPDRWALIPIWIHPKMYLAPPAEGELYNMVRLNTNPNQNDGLLWHPMQFQESIWHSREVVQAIVNCEMGGFQEADMKLLSRAITRLFMGDFRQEVESKGGFRFPVEICHQYFQGTARLVVDWCLFNYTSDPWTWLDICQKLDIEFDYTAPGEVPYSLRKIPVEKRYQFASQIPSQSIPVQEESYGRPLQCEPEPRVAEAARQTTRATTSTASPAGTTASHPTASPTGGLRSPQPIVFTTRVVKESQ